MGAYRIEIAKQGRAGCKGRKPCKGTKILKGELRFGTFVQIPDGKNEGGTRDSFQWRHWGCVTNQVMKNAIASIGTDPTDLDGFEEIDEENQERIKTAFREGHIAEEDVTVIEESEEGEEGEDKEEGTSEKKSKSKTKSKKAKKDDGDAADEEDKPKKKASKAKKPPVDEDSGEEPEKTKPKRKSKSQKVADEDDFEEAKTSKKRGKAATGGRKSKKAKVDEDEDE